MKISASIVFAAVFPICCGESPRVITAEAPLKSVEIYGAMAIADLRSGVAARTVVGPNLFGDFEPGVRPEAIETRFGRAADVVTRGDDLTLFIYERQGQRVAVVRQIVTGSSGGPKGTSYHLEAYPPPHFEETLPQALQDVIRSSSSVRQIAFRSDVRGDWNIHLQIERGHVQSVSATLPLPQ